MVPFQGKDVAVLPTSVSQDAQMAHQKVELSWQRGKSSLGFIGGC